MIDSKKDLWFKHLREGYRFFFNLLSKIKLFNSERNKYTVHCRVYIINMRSIKYF